MTYHRRRGEPLCRQGPVLPWQPIAPASFPVYWPPISFLRIDLRGAATLAEPRSSSLTFLILASLWRWHTAIRCLQFWFSIPGHIRWGNMGHACSLRENVTRQSAQDGWESSELIDVSQECTPCVPPGLVSEFGRESASSLELCHDSRPELLHTGSKRHSNIGALAGAQRDQHSIKPTAKHSAKLMSLAGGSY